MLLTLAVGSSVPFGMNRIDSIVVADRMKADTLLREIPENEDDEAEEQGEDDDEGEEDGEGYSE
jgi:hypothetical protein